MDTTYLVDLENIGSNALYEHAKSHLDAEYIIFYSENTTTPSIMLEHLPKESRVSFVNCHAGENNAMDFCICMMVGRLSAAGQPKIKILSKDRGYDPMVRLSHELGMRVKREDISQNQQAKYVPVQGQEPENAINWDLFMEIIRRHVPKKDQAHMRGVAMKISSRKDLYEACQSILPQNYAVDVYRKLKKAIPKGGL